MSGAYSVQWEWGVNLIKALNVKNIKTSDLAPFFFISNQIELWFLCLIEGRDVSHLGLNSFIVDRGRGLIGNGEVNS